MGLLGRVLVVMMGGHSCLWQLALLLSACNCEAGMPREMSAMDDTLSLSQNMLTAQALERMTTQQVADDAPKHKKRKAYRKSKKSRTAKSFPAGRKKHRVGADM